MSKIGLVAEAGLRSLPAQVRAPLTRLFLKFTPHRFRLSVAGRAMRALGPDDYLTIVDGPLRGMYWIAHSHLHSCVAGTYEEESQAVLERYLGPGKVVYDVGACVGFLTLLASRLVGPTGRVFSFEPQPKALSYLQRHITLNQLANVDVLPVAVSASEGQARFVREEHLALGHLGNDGQIRVRVVTLDGVRARRDLPTPDLVKIDVEGGELDVLRGGYKLFREVGPVLLLSTHGSESYQACRQLLGELGYQIEELDLSWTIGPYDHMSELLAVRQT